MNQYHLDFNTKKYLRYSILIYSICIQKGVFYYASRTRQDRLE